MAMVISPRSKIVTLSLLIGIITLVALIITGVIGIWNGKSEKTSTATRTKMVSSKLQQVTGYAAMQHQTNSIAKFPGDARDGRNADAGLEGDKVKSRTFNAILAASTAGPADNTDNDVLRGPSYNGNASSTPLVAVAVVVVVVGVVAVGVVVSYWNGPNQVISSRSASIIIIACMGLRSITAVHQRSRSHEAEVEAVPQENAWNFEEGISRVTAISRLRSEDGGDDDDDGDIDVVGNEPHVCVRTNRLL
ncbi:hypothetical protein X777_04494 [Ooceraea biroi]|uniref:Uncharacterized protein n=1 Tax=Ooceraea biroi TaxID=2015173 RepID=A0A026WFY6_OOCBI|nr:hypothetical protein X777_04494 [Ooceraea biroi]